MTNSFKEPLNEVNHLNQAYVYEADDQTFESLVIQKSLQVPILVDCWAEWCGPCQALGPTLEKLAAQYKGRFELVKVNIDHAQRVAMALRVQSVPFMMLFINGRPIDALVGNQSESDLKAFLDKHLPVDESDPYESGLTALKNGEYDQAIQFFQQAMIEYPNRAEIRLAMARASLAIGDLDSANQLLDSIPQDDQCFQSAQHLKALFSLVEFQDHPDSLAQRLVEDPKDVDAWYRLGVTSALNGEYQTACEAFLKVVSIDRTYQEDGGRTALLLIFEVLGGEGDVVSTYRRALASYLF